MAIRKVFARALVIGVGVIAAVPIPTASACEFPYCDPDYFLPYEGSVPANLAGIQWRPGSYGVNPGPTMVRDDADLEFVCESAPGVTHDVAFHVEGDGAARLIVVDEPLVPAETCALRLQPEATPCQWFGSQSPRHVQSAGQFVVTQTAPEPVSLGVIDAEAARLQTTRVEFFTGCGSKEIVVCGVEIGIAFDAEAAPWRDALVFETLVDGEPWDVQVSAAHRNPTGGSFVGRSKDLVFARGTAPVDGTDPGTTFGTHTVVMRATLPGTDVMLETAPTEITLDCGGGNRDDAGAADAGVLLDASSDFDASHNLHPIWGPGPDVDEGCSCSVAGPRVTHSFAWLWSLAVIALLAVRRMRHVKSVVVVGLGLWLAAPIETASACGSALCEPEKFLPFRGSLPVNAPGIWWQPGGVYGSDGGLADATSPDDLMFRCTNGSAAPRTIRFHVEGDGELRVLVPDDLLRVGESCEIAASCSDPIEVGEPVVYAAFTITEAAPLPATSLGFLAFDVARFYTVIETNEATCEDIQSEVCGITFSPVLPDQVMPWADVLLYETRVNATSVWATSIDDNNPGQSATTRFVYLRPLAYELPLISMRARLPGTDIELTTESTSVGLYCAVPNDAGSAGTGAWDPVHYPDMIDDTPEDGCSCAIVGRPVRNNRAWWAGLLMLSLLASVRIRSNRATSRSPRSRA